MPKRLPRYNKRCEGCGKLYGNKTAALMAYRRFCTRACFNKTQQPRSSRTHEVERLGETGMTQTAIAKRVGIRQCTVSRIILRKRREDAI